MARVKLSEKYRRPPAYLEIWRTYYEVGVIAGISRKGS